MKTWKIAKISVEHILYPVIAKFVDIISHRQMGDKLLSELSKTRFSNFCV